MSGRDGHEAFLAKILDHCTCEVCSRPLTRSDVVAVRRSEAMWLINVVCSSCQSRGLIFVLIKDAAAVRGGVDLESGAPPADDTVTPEDCRALHDFLRAFDGDCLDLIRALG